MTCAIDIIDLNFRYDSFALRDITTQLHIGEQKAVVGLNGSGKTTLFKLIVGLLRPLSGEVYVLDRRVTPEDLWEIRQQVGFLFQNPEDQLFAPTVWEDVAFGPQNMGLSNEEVEDRVVEALSTVDLLDLADRPVNQLSHGQAKRVALAGVIAMRPKVLLLDEPFAGLDFPMVEAVVDTIERLRRRGVSVLYTTHSRFFLENWADSVLVLESGRVVYDGPADEALREPRVLGQVGDWGRLRESIHRSRTVPLDIDAGLGADMEP